MSEVKKVFLEKKATLRLTSFNQSRVYGFTCQTFENDDVINTIHYKVTIACTYSHNNSFFFEIHRQQVYIDNTAPDLKIEQIADACSAAIFPVMVEVSWEGDIVNITNHDAIKQRWPPIKERLSKYYEGDIVAKILHKIQDTINNKTLLAESLCKSWFFHLYFRPLYTQYKQNEPHGSVWESPVFGSQTISYGVQQTVEEHYSATDKIFINVQGNSVDKRSIEEVLNGYSYPKSEMAGIKVEPVASQMEVQYKLYGEDHSIYSVIGTYKTAITAKKHKTIQVEMYHLPEDSSFRPPARGEQKDMSSFFVAEGAPVKEKGGFWSWFKL